MAALEVVVVEAQPRLAEGAYFCGNGECGAVTALTPPCEVLAPPMMASTAVLMLAGSTDNSADSAISFDGLK